MPLPPEEVFAAVVSDRGEEQALLASVAYTWKGANDEVRNGPSRRLPGEVVRIGRFHLVEVVEGEARGRGRHERLVAACRGLRTAANHAAEEREAGAGAARLTLAAEALEEALEGVWSALAAVERP